MVKALLKTGTDVNAQNNNGWATAIMSAVWKGHGEIVDTLLQADVDLDIRNNKGDTALDIAVKGGVTKLSN